MNTYNTQKNKLIIREYGRNIQNMIAHAKTIEEDEKRQNHIEAIVDLIMLMHPHTRNIEDYRLKVWSHVVQMAEYDLQVAIPDNIPSTKEPRIPDTVAYPSLTRRFRHYGRNVRTMIAKAKGMEDEEKKAAFVAMIGSYMKMSYKEHNRENVQDDVIISEFKVLANGDLEIPEGTDLDGHSQPQPPKRHSNNHKKDSRRSNKNKSNKSNKSPKAGKSNNRGKKTNVKSNQRSRKR